MRCILAFSLVGSLPLLYGQHVGRTNHSVSEECEALKAELDKLWIDQKQMKQGIVGGVVTATDCKQLHDVNVMDYRTNEEQAILCSNPCYNNTAHTYAQMLNLDCFQGIDEYENANQKLFAASFQFGCQQNGKSVYCVPLLGETIQSAGTKYDICSDIVSSIGCCFESYKRYMQFGTSRSIDELRDIEQVCGSSVSDLNVPCTCNPGNEYATLIKEVKVCGNGNHNAIPWLGLLLWLVLSVIPH